MSASRLVPEQRQPVVASATDLASWGQPAADACGPPALIPRGADDADRRNDRDQPIVAGAPFRDGDEVVRTLVAEGAALDAGTPSGRDAARTPGRGGLLQAGV